MRKEGRRNMKRHALIISIGLIFILSISQGLLAQRFGRDIISPRRGYDYYDFNLTEEQLKKIQELEIILEKELSPLYSKLRLKDHELQQLYAQPNPDERKIEINVNEINKIENTIVEKEMLHWEKIRNLLTDEQNAIFDSYYGDFEFYRGPYGRGLGKWGWSNYGYGRGVHRGARLGRGYFGRGIGRWDTRNFVYGRGFYGGIRLGRCPCGLGLGRWYWSNYGYGGRGRMSRWNWGQR